MNLYEMSQEYQEVLEQIYELDLPMEVVRDTLDSIREPLYQKAENTVKVIQTIRNHEETIRAEEKRLAERRRAFANSRKNVTQWLTDSLDHNLEDPRIKTALFTIYVQNNPPSLKVDDESQIPLEYFEQQPDKLKKRELLNDIRNNGLHVDGVEVVQTRGVRFR